VKEILGGGLIIDNPCKECLVQAACNKGCYMLVAYLIEKLDTRQLIELSYENYEYIADELRRENMTLIDNNTRINWVPDKYWEVRKELR